MKKYIAFLLAAASLLSLLSACSKNKASVFFLGVDSPAGTFDPQIVSDATAEIIVRNCFEGLLRKDENGNIVNGAAESFTVSGDGLIYTFNLRKDAVWHLTSNAKKQAGEKLPENFDLGVTAEDFVFAFKRGVNPDTASAHRYMLENIAGAKEIIAGSAGIDTLGVKALDRYTLEIRLSVPQKNFTEILCEPICMPCNEAFFNTTDGRYGTMIKFLLSNGPFYLSRFDDVSYRINKAEDYKGSAAAAPDAVWIYCESEQQISKKLEENDLSAALLSQNAYKNLKVSKYMKTEESPDVLRCFIMNTQDSDFSNPDIRRAFACATDTVRFSEGMGKTAVKGFLPSAAADKRIISHSSAYNEKTAVSILEDALKAEKKNSLNVTLLCEAEYESAIRRLFQEWQKIFGIRVNLAVEVLPYDELEQAVRSGSFQIAFFPLRLSAENPYEYFEALSEMYAYKNESAQDENSQSRGPSSDEYANSIKKLITELYSGSDSDFAERYALIERELINMSPLIPVWEENSYFITTKNVDGIMHLSGKNKIYFHNAVYSD